MNMEACCGLFNKETAEPNVLHLQRAGVCTGAGLHPKHLQR